MGPSRLLLLGLIASAAVSTFAAQSDPAPATCDLGILAPMLARHCQSDPDVPSFLLSPTAQCREALGASLPAQQELALPCLCHAAADPGLTTANLDATRLFALYRGCNNASFSRDPSFAYSYCEVEKTGDTATAMCRAASLAARVARFCVRDKRTAECCMAVVPTVGLTGRPPCLCRVAAEPQLAATGLNVTGILELYFGVCTGRHLEGIDECKDWHLPVPPPVPSYQGVTTAAVLAPTMAASPSCSPRNLAFSMVSYVLGDRTVESCMDLVASVDLGGGVPCLCLTAGEYATFSAGLKATDLLANYNACGGLRLGGADHKAAAASCDGYGLPPQQHDGGAIRIRPDTLPEAETDTT